MKKLEEGQNKLWEEVRLIRIDYDRMRKYMRVGFGDLGRALRVTFEDHSASFLEVLLEELGYPDARIERKVLVHDGEAVEIKMFCEDPLVVGEATISIESMKEAEKR